MEEGRNRKKEKSKWFLSISWYFAMLVWIAHPFTAFAWRYCPNDPPSLSVNDAWKLLFHSRNSFYRAKLVNVRDSTLMCFTAPVGPTDRPRFFSLYWIPQICKHNWSESFNTRERTWPSFGFYKPCIQKTRGWVPLSVACLLWLHQLSLTSEVSTLFHFFLFCCWSGRKIFLSIQFFIPPFNKPSIWRTADFAIHLWGCFFIEQNIQSHRKWWILENNRLGLCESERQTLRSWDMLYGDLLPAIPPGWALKLWAKRIGE